MVDRHSPEIHEISRNVAIGSAELPREIVASWEQERVLHGSRYATFFHPEFVDIYRDGVSRLMAGIVTLRARPHPWSDSIFGFSEVGVSESTGRVPLLIIPGLDKQYLSQVDDPTTAIHNYHTQLIDQTNAALGRLASPYRLEPLPLEHQQRR